MYRDLEPARVAEICSAYVEGDSTVPDILARFQIDAETFKMICERKSLDILRAHYIDRKQRAATDDLGALYEATRASMKEMLRLMAEDIFDMWKRQIRNENFLPKTPEGLANAFQKVADTYSRVNEDGDLKPKAIEILITGVKPELPPATVVQQLIGTSKEAEDCAITTEIVTDQ